jgi:hypothetical protein
MNENLENLAWESGLMSQGTPDEWDLKALETFGRRVARQAIQLALDNDDPFTARDIGNYFGIYE